MAVWQDTLQSRTNRSRRRPIIGRVKLEELRAWFAEPPNRFGTLPKDIAFEPATMGQVRGEWVNPADGPIQRIILYFHGGGYISGSPETHRPLAARLAGASDAQTLSVAYRLAPECPYPGAVRDGLDSYRWLLAQKVPPQAIALAGDCAGGGLALGVAMAIRNADLQMPACLVAMSPWADLTLSGPSVLDNAEADGMMTWAALTQCAQFYLGGASPTEQFASPAFGDFKGLPPMMIHAGAQEILRDDAGRVGERAAAAGVRVSVEVYDGQPHLFQALGSKEANVSIERLGAFIRTQTTAAMRRRTDGG